MGKNFPFLKKQTKQIFNTVNDMMNNKQQPQQQSFNPFIQNTSQNSNKNPYSQPVNPNSNAYSQPANPYAKMDPVTSKG